MPTFDSGAGDQTQALTLVASMLSTGLPPQPSEVIF